MLTLLITSTTGFLSQIVVAQQNAITLNPVADASVFRDDPDLAIGDEIWLRVSYSKEGKVERSL